jgi:hypothetical protein
MIEKKKFLDFHPDFHTYPNFLIILFLHTKKILKKLTVFFFKTVSQMYCKSGYIGQYECLVNS